MLETNIRIVQSGEGLRLVVRRASLEGPDLSNDLVERACGTLRYPVRSCGHSNRQVRSARALGGRRPARA